MKEVPEDLERAALATLREALEARVVAYPIAEEGESWKTTGTRPGPDWSVRLEAAREVLRLAGYGPDVPSRPTGKPSTAAS